MATALSGRPASSPCSYGTGPGWCDGRILHANKRAAVHGHPGLNVVNKIIDTPATFNVIE